jgi:peptidoglycan DL-endopeptidase LytE
VKKTIVAASTTALLSSAFVTMASADTHRVEPGDSLWSISKKYNIQIVDLKQWNGLEKDVIYPNQALKVKAGMTNTPQNALKPSSNDKNLPTQSKVYKVKSGDSLSKIANEQGINLKDLMHLNNITSHLIFPGQTLVLSKSTVGSTEPKTKEQSSQTTPATPALKEKYTVKQGDTLSGISLQMNVSVKNLKQWNALSSDMIFVGQELKLDKSKSTSSSPVSVPFPVSENSKDANVIGMANSLLGTPYLWGGATVEGFDCSGFIYYVFKQAGKSINRHSSEGYYNRSYYINTPQIGDLVFFENTYKKGISHLGIYAGDNQFIHASDFGVAVTSLDEPYWKSKFDGFKRFY